MKRSIFLAISLGVALLGITAIALAQTPSVPNLINFQGRLTDNVGNPVANGAHTVNFYIFPVRTGGLDVWNEATTQTTTGGLFTTQLGLVTPLPLTLFEDYDSLFLELVADAQTIAPRTLLTATPSTRVANALESSVGSTVYSKSYNYPGLGGALYSYHDNGPILGGLEPSFFGSGGFFGVERDDAYNLGFAVYGNGDGLNNPYVYINGPLNSTTFNMTTTGDPSVLLPTDAVNSGEILDEPGVSNSDNFGFLTLGTGAGTTYLLDSVDISIPASGYVEVTCDGYMNLAHTTGTSSSFYTTLSKTQGDGSIYPGCAVARVPSAIATTFDWAFPMSSSRLFVESGPATYRYYVMITHETGTNLSSNGLDFYSLRAKYFPTLYGTTTLAKTGIGANSSVSSTASGTSAPLSNAGVTTITVADHNARLEAERAKQVAELEARIKRLEETARLQAGQQGQSMQAPRKER